jgi:transcription termination/antitermination protein NusG
LRLGIPIPTLTEPPKWFAIHTASNHERAVARQLQERSIPFFLPTYKQVNRWSDRRKEMERPLFPGYLFVHIQLHAKLNVLRVPGVVRLVGSSQGPSEIPPEEIEPLQQAMVSKGQIAPHDCVKVGSRVRVMHGPFAGITGCLVRKENQLRVVVAMESIHQAFSMQVDLRDMEVIGEPRVATAAAGHV